MVETIIWSGTCIGCLPLPWFVPERVVCLSKGEGAPLYTGKQALSLSLSLSLSLILVPS